MQQAQTGKYRKLFEITSSAYRERLKAVKTARLMFPPCSKDARLPHSRNFLVKTATGMNGTPS